MDDGMSVELVHGGHDAILELLFGCDADVAQDRAGELGEETLDEIEPSKNWTMTMYETPRGHRGRHAGKEWSAKARNHSWVA